MKPISNQWLFVFSFLVIVISISFNGVMKASAGYYSQYIYDIYYNLPEEDKFEIEKIMKGRDLILVLHDASEEDEKYFEEGYLNFGESNFYHLFQEKKPLNVMIYIIRYVPDKNTERYKVAYFYSEKCKILENEIQKLTAGEVSGPLEGRDILDIVKNTIKRADYAKEVVDEDCILNECKLISEGKDLRYKVFTCQPKDNSRPENHHYICVNGYGKRIKCIYDDETYYNEIEREKFNIKEVFVVTSVNGGMPTDEDKIVEYEDEVIMYVIFKTDSGDYYSGDNQNNPPFQEAGINGRVVPVKKSPTEFNVIFKEYIPVSEHYKKGEPESFKTFEILNPPDTWKTLVEIKSETLFDNPFSYKMVGSGTNWFGVEIPTANLISNIIRVSKKGNMEYKDLVPVCEKDGSCDSEKAGQVADYMNTMMIYHVHFSSDFIGSEDEDCENIWSADCADLHLSTAWHYGLLDTGSPPCSTVGAKHLGMMERPVLRILRKKITEQRTDWPGNYIFKYNFKNARPSEIQEFRGFYFVSEQESSTLKIYTEDGEYLSNSFLDCINPLGIHFNDNYLLVADAFFGAEPDYVSVFSYILTGEPIEFTSVYMKGPYDSYSDRNFDSDPTSFGTYDNNIYVLSQDWETILRYSVEDSDDISRDFSIKYGEEKKADPFYVFFGKQDYTGTNEIKQAILGFSVNRNPMTIRVDEKEGIEERPPIVNGNLNVKINSVKRSGDEYRLDLTVTLKNTIELKPKNWEGKTTNRIFVGEADGGKKTDYVFEEETPQSAGIDTHREKSITIADGKIYVSLGINKIKVYDANTGKYIKEFGNKFLSDDVGRIKSDGERLYISDTGNKAVFVTDFNGKKEREIKVEDDLRIYSPYTVAVGENLIAVGVFTEKSRRGMVFIDKETTDIVKKYIQEDMPLKKIKKGVEQDAEVKVGLGENEIRPGDLFVVGDYEEEYFGHTMGFFADSKIEGKIRNVESEKKCDEIAEEECKDYNGVYDSYLFEEERICNYKCKYGNGILDKDDVTVEYGPNYDNLPHSFVIRKWTGF